MTQYLTLKKKNFLNKNPEIAICLSFVGTILIGTFLLNLPFATKPGFKISLFDCFFTASSTVCISGVVIYDTFTHWSFFGQLVILILTQLGALGVITFYSIFAIYLNKKINLKNMKVVGDQISTSVFANFKSVFKNVLHITLFFEFFGGLALCFMFYPKFKSYGIFMAFFTAISAYCNAGLDLNGIIAPDCSFIPFSHNYFSLTIVSILTIAGGLGFIVIHEIIELKKQHKKLKFLSIHSKLALCSTTILIVLGSLIFFVLEIENSLANSNLFDSIFTSFFHSISARSNGFLTLNLNNLTNLTKTFICALMLIGGCPSGTGGGIKTTTFSIIFATTINTVKNCNHVSLFKHKIKETDVYKAISTLFITITTIATASILIYKFENLIELPTIIFSVISVLSNTGFQTVPILNFNIYSKIVFIFLMLIGRIGLLSFTSTFFKKRNSKVKLTLPESKIQVN